MIVSADSGPLGSPTSKDGAGFLARSALRYTVDAGEAARRRLPPLDGADDIVGRTVAVGDVLRSYVFPALDRQHIWGATHVALDLVFEDGSRLSELDPRDQHGNAATAAGQGEGEILYADQWNDVQVDLSAAVGRTITSVELAADAPYSPGSVTFSGWIDGPYLGPAAQDPPIEDPVAWVDTRRGTYASGDFSRGNTLPLTAWPNGFVFFTPATDARTSRWVYEYHRRNGDDNRPRLQALSLSHQPSPWMADRLQFQIMPLLRIAEDGTPQGDPAARSLGFDHAAELARPDLYQVDLDGGVRMRLAPTDHGAIAEISFGPDAGVGERHVLFEGIDERSRVDASGAVLDSRLTAWVDPSPEEAADGATRMFVLAEVDPVPVRASAASGSSPGGTVLTFPEGTERVTVRLVTSFIGLSQAERTFVRELRGRRLEQVREAAHAEWSRRLSVVEVEGATPPQRRTLAGNLYRLNLYPNSHWEDAGTPQRPRPVHASPVLPTQGEATANRTNARIVPGMMHVNHGFWDTYRTCWPAYALLYPELAAVLAGGFVQQHREGGWIARWSSPGYADCMTGTSSDISFADLAVKGIPLPDPLSAYESGLRNATVAPETSRVGRKGNERAVFTGFVDIDTEESVSWTLEAHINDAGLAAQAELLSQDRSIDALRREELAQESAYLRARSANYVLLFDPEIGFFQGRRRDGMRSQSPQDFDPCVWGGDFTETDGWNFAFHVPQDGEGLAALHGGREGLREKLEEFFSVPEDADRKGTYGHVIHEMDEARAVRMGQFGMSNQPSHHIPFLFHHAGVPHRAMEVVGEVRRRLFVGEEIGQGYPGDEDNGEMSAWWLLTALGIYPVQLGTVRYHLVAPMFPRARVRPLGGPAFTVSAEGGSMGRYVTGLSVRGTEHRRAAIDHGDLHGELVFTLGDTPNGWGEVPPSPTPEGEQPRPLLDLLPADAEDPLRDDDSRTEMSFDGPEAVIDLVSFDEPVPARFYTLTSGVTEGGDPVSWRLEVSGDLETWSVLDERRDQEFRWRRQTRPFRLDGAVPAQHYRLVVTASKGPLVLAEVELLH